MGLVVMVVVGERDEKGEDPARAPPSFPLPSFLEELPSPPADDATTAPPPLLDPAAENPSPVPPDLDEVPPPSCCCCWSLSFFCFLSSLF